MLWPDETQPRWEQAAGTVDFQLSYHKSRETRVFSYAEIDGEPLDDVWSPGDTQSGLWMIGDRPIFTRDDTVETWQNFYTEAAFQESIHEVLEYLKLDGEQWMNPHGEYEMTVFKEVNRFVSRLRAIRNGDDPNEVK